MIHVIDNAIPDPMEYLEDARKSMFQALTFGADTFQGIAFCTRSEVADAAASVTDARPVLSFFRQSPEGQSEPNYVHSDEMMGRYTGIYYMNPEPPEGDGTAFWERDGDGWKMVRLVPAKFNRLLTFPADLRHSRALFDNYGHGDGARLIQVVFLK